MPLLQQFSILSEDKKHFIPFDVAFALHTKTRVPMLMLPMFPTGGAAPPSSFFNQYGIESMKDQET